MYVSKNKQLVGFRSFSVQCWLCKERDKRRFAISNVSMGNEVIERACRKCCLGHREIIAFDSKNRANNIYIVIRNVY
jgi:hypothetical protein